MLVSRFVPRWTKELKAARRPINVRAGTVWTTAMLRDSFAHRRCIVPMDACYESSGEKPPKQSWAVARRRHLGRLARGGRFDLADLRGDHHRGDRDAAAEVLLPAPNDVLRAWPVSRAVNDVRRDGPELLEPMEEVGGARSATGC